MAKINSTDVANLRKPHKTKPKTKPTTAMVPQVRRQALLFRLLAQGHQRCEGAGAPGRRERRSGGRSCPAARGPESATGAAPTQPRCLRIGRVKSDSRLRCRPSSSKLAGSSHARKACRSAGHSTSMAAYQAVSRLRPL